MSIGFLDKFGEGYLWRMSLVSEGDVSDKVAYLHAEGRVSVRNYCQRQQTFSPKRFKNPKNFKKGVMPLDERPFHKIFAELFLKSDRFPVPFVPLK